MQFDHKLIAWKIKKKREQFNLTLYEVSQMLLIDKYLLIQYESGEIEIPAEFCKLLSLYYGLNLNYLFGLPDDFPNQKIN